MLGFRKRRVAPDKTLVAAALARLDAAEAALTAAPADPARREEFRQAHNAVADLLADSPNRA